MSKKMLETQVLDEFRKEQVIVLMEKYKKTLELLDAYDHQTPIRPEGAYYDDCESVEEMAARIIMIDKSREEEQKMIISVVMNCIL